MTAQINRPVKVTVGLSGVATLTIEGHEQGDPEYPKVALGDLVLHGLRRAGRSAVGVLVGRT
ncbi:hypothetical protein [Streptomyces sp. NBC_00996]|uniref:hypothetical protein n=1 Tax=Streptomyces sp. NBC_00996 TaxID=2903710 RepID=UPI00386CC974|nr:hypothetical protein OG390_40800 [Streptomyces sp. NBC_00996]